MFLKTVSCLLVKHFNFISAFQGLMHKWDTETSKPESKETVLTIRLTRHIILYFLHAFKKPGYTGNWFIFTSKTNDVIFLYLDSHFIRTRTDLRLDLKRLETWLERSIVLHTYLNTLQLISHAWPFITFSDRSEAFFYDSPHLRKAIKQSCYIPTFVGPLWTLKCQ